MYIIKNNNYPSNKFGNLIITFNLINSNIDQEQELEKLEKLEAHFSG